MKTLKLLPRLIAGFGLMMMLASGVQAANVDLTLTFSDSPDPVFISSPVTYSINVANGDMAKADNVKVTVPLPTGATYVSGCSLSGSNVVCDFGDINKNTSKPLSFIVNAPASGGTMNATATVTTSDTNTLANTKNTTTAVSAIRILPNQSFSVLTGTANGTVVGTVVTAGQSPTDFNITGTAFAISKTGVITVANSAALVAGIQAPIVGVTSSSGAFSESVTITVTQRESNLALTNTDSVDPVITNAAYSYTLGVSNAGPHNATDLVLTDTLPVGVIFQSAVGTGWSCNEAGGLVVCQNPNLATNASSNVVITVLAPVIGGTITNTATVISSGTDVNPANNTDIEQSTTVQAKADLQIVKTGPASVIVNNTIQYTLSVTNLGPSATDNVTVTDVLPSGVGYQIYSGNDWVCSFTTATRTLSCTHPTTLGINETSAITLVATAPSSVPSPAGIINTATVSGPLFDPVNTNNTSSKTTTVTAASYTSKNVRPFALFRQDNVNGDIQTIGNSVMLVSGTPPVCAAAGAVNNNLNTVYADRDTDPITTLNSTSADLVLPPKVRSSDILYAMLYWQGRTTATNQIINGKTVKIKPFGLSSYQTVTSLDTKFNWTGNDYQGAVEVTTLIKDSLDYVGHATLDSTGYNKPLWIGDVFANKLGSNSNGYGAWSLIIAYKDAAAKLRNISTYDGYDVVASGSPRSATLSGFLTPSSGAVDSKFLVFAGEGDSNYISDQATLTNKAGTPISVGANTFRSVEDINGVNVTNRNPNCPNTIGVDLRTFNVGTTGSTPIIQNGQTTTTVTMSSSQDQYFPGAFAFSTELYIPNVCYNESITYNNLPISGTNLPVSGTNVDYTVTITNLDAEDANGVFVEKVFNTPMQISYAASSMEVAPIPGTTFSVKTDKVADDTAEYSSAATTAKFLLGTGAAWYQGGTILQNQQTKFKYKAKVGNVQLVEESGYKLSYRNDLLHLTFEGISAPKCVDFNNSFAVTSGEPVTADFNVVYATNINNSLSSGYNYNLPTAIASRADNYKVIALNAGTDTLKSDMNTTVGIELVDADTSNVCSNMTSLSERIWVVFNNSSNTDFTPSTIWTNSGNLITPESFYQKAAKNVVFRIAKNEVYGSGDLVKTRVITSGQHAGNIAIDNFTELAQGLINYNSNLAPNLQNKCVAPVVVGNQTYTTMPQSCGNAADQNGLSIADLQICMQCVYGANTPASCSKDNFAIRPEAFYVKLSDQNQTNIVAKQVMNNNISGPATLNLASGYQYYAEVNATNHSDNGAVTGYSTIEGLDSIWTPAGTVVTGCNDDSNKSSVLSFTNGVAEGNLSVDQVGKYSLNITDDQWSSVDSNVSTMSHHTSPLFLSGTDCTLNSADTSALGTYNGCNVSSNHVNSDAGITYTDSSIAYMPYKFNLAGIQMAKGQSFAGNIMGQNTWTYMNSVNVDENMSIRYFGPIQAEGKTGTLLSNFVNNCYAQPINFESNLTFPIAANLQTLRYRLQEVNANNQVWNDTNATFLSPVSSSTFNLLTVPASSFLKDKNGLIDVNLSLNFDRNQITVINPITVGLQNFQIKCNPLVDCSSRADFSTTHLPDANVTTDNNTTFVYGRIIPRDIRVFGTTTPFSVNGWYEVFNTPAIGTTTLPKSKNDSAWFTNTLHNDGNGIGNDGDANVTVVVTGGNPVNGPAVNGVETYWFAPYGLGSYQAHILTKPWLWHGTAALPYLDPANPANLDCFTHPCFNINVVPSIGATGSAKGGAEGNKASKRSTGGGAWHSTTDYSPAIR